jgi:hypothetical protein
MNEYDLFKSIGEVDEKLMNRYDAKTAREVKKSARRVRLIVDLVVLLLLFAAVVLLFLHPTKKKIRMPSGACFGAKAAYAAVGFSADAPAAQAVGIDPET